MKINRRIALIAIALIMPLFPVFSAAKVNLQQLAATGTPSEIKQTIKKNKAIQNQVFTDNRLTFMMLVLQNNREIEVVSQCISSGLRLTDKDANKKSVLMYACQYSSRPDVVELIIRKAASTKPSRVRLVVEQDHDGHTPFYYARHNVQQNYDVYKVLQKYAVDPDDETVSSLQGKAHELIGYNGMPASQSEMEINTDPSQVLPSSPSQRAQKDTSDSESENGSESEESRKILEENEENTADSSDIQSSLEETEIQSDYSPNEEESTFIAQEEGLSENQKYTEKTEDEEYSPSLSQSELEESENFVPEENNLLALNNEEESPFNKIEENRTRENTSSDVSLQKDEQFQEETELIEEEALEPVSIEKEPAIEEPKKSELTENTPFSATSKEPEQVQKKAELIEEEALEPVSIEKEPAIEEPKKSELTENTPFSATSKEPEQVQEKAELIEEEALEPVKIEEKTPVEEPKKNKIAETIQEETLEPVKIEEKAPVSDKKKEDKKTQSLPKAEKESTKEDSLLPLKTEENLSETETNSASSQKTKNKKDQKKKASKESSKSSTSSASIKAEDKKTNEKKENQTEYTQAESEEKSEIRQYSQKFLYDFINEVPEENALSEEKSSFNGNPDQCDENGVTLLMKACKAGNDWDVRRLLEAGADVQKRDRDGWTALMYAVRYQNSMQIVQMLVEKGAYTRVRNKYNTTPLLFAADFTQNPEILSYFLKNRTASEEEVFKAFILSLTNNRGEDHVKKAKIQLFLDMGIPVNRIWKGKTPLMYAAQYGSSTAVLKLLIDNGARPGIQNSEGKKAFDYAKENSRLEHNDVYWSLNSSK